MISKLKTLQVIISDCDDAAAAADTCTVLLWRTKACLVSGIRWTPHCL